MIVSLVGSKSWVSSAGIREAMTSIACGRGRTATRKATTMPAQALSVIHHLPKLCKENLAGDL